MEVKNLENKFSSIIEPVKKQITLLAETNQKIYERKEFANDLNLQTMFRCNLLAQMECISILDRLALL